MLQFEKHPVLGIIPPYLNFLILPDSEQDTAIHHMAYVGELWTAAWQFHSAVKLFDFCEQSKPDETDWKLIAARDGVWSIYNLGFTMKYFRSGLGDMPTLRNLIDHQKLRAAQKQFITWFPDFELIRHALAHVPETTMNQQKRSDNYYRGPYKSDGMIIEGDKTSIMLKNGLNGRTYQTTFNSRLLSYEISTGTLGQLVEVKDQFYSGLQRIVEESMKAPHWRPAKN